MVEWSITAVLKTAVLRGTGGSNPSLSANLMKGRKREAAGSLFLFLRGFVVMYHYVLIMYRSYLVLFTVHNKLFPTCNQMKI